MLAMAVRWPTNLAFGVPYIGLRPYGRAYSLVVIRDAADYCGTPLKRDLGSRPLRRGMSDERDTLRDPYTPGCYVRAR
jgi:hypothetical protein